MIINIKPAVKILNIRRDVKMGMTGGYTTIPLVIDYTQLTMGTHNQGSKWITSQVLIKNKQNLSDEMHIIGDALIKEMETLNDDDYSFVLSLLPELKLYT